MNKQVKIQKVFDLMEPITSSLNINLGMCSKRYLAVAGTGSYRNLVGTLRPGPTHREVINTGKPVIMENKKYSRLCIKCLVKNDCKYRSGIFFPVLSDQGVEGVIYAISNKSISNQTDLFINVLKRLSDLILDIESINLKLFENTMFLSSLLDKSDDKKTLVNYVINAEEVITAGKISNELNPSYEHSIFLNENPSRKSIYQDKVLSIISPRKKESILDISYEPSKPQINARDSLSQIISQSKTILELKEQAKLIANMDTSVLIIGETGTGKELFAQGIHEYSQRANRKLISINCGAIPENLVESELFGYVKGSFTGANTEGKKGKIELAHEGTLLLDEVGEMPLSIQTKLLRMLETNTIDRIGASEPTSVNVRVIAATNRDIENMVQQGQFRADLYYRLNVITLELPPLRERKEDIPLLVQHFLDVYNRKFQKTLIIENSVLNHFISYNWPGNIRELKNVLESTVALENSNIITFMSLPKWFKEKSLTHALHFSENISDLNIVEKQVIEKTLETFGYTTEGKKEAAKTLGISLSTLYRKISFYNIKQKC